MQGEASRSERTNTNTNTTTTTTTTTHHDDPTTKHVAVASDWPRCWLASLSFVSTVA